MKRMATYRKPESTLSVVLGGILFVGMLFTAWTLVALVEAGAL